MYTHLLLFCVQRDARLLQNVDIGGNRGVVVQIMKESRMVKNGWHKLGTKQGGHLIKNVLLMSRVARHGGTGAPAENLRPEHTLFCGELRFVAIYALFGEKCPFLDQKQCFLGKKYTITWYILHISLS